MTYSVYNRKIHVYSYKTVQKEHSFEIRYILCQVKLLQLIELITRY